jgi:hypothetical protein
MEKFGFSQLVFEKGAGKIYYTLNAASMPAMVFGVMEIALINSGGMKQFADYPNWVKIMFLMITVIYVIPCLFIFPTTWMLRSWRKSALQNNYILVGRKSLEYHMLANTLGDMRENNYVATQIKKVEETKTKMIIKGNIVEKSTGNTSDELKIPIAFDGMDRIKRLARYR